MNKIAEGRPNVLDIILNKQVNLIINTPWAKRDAIKDESAIRKAAIKYKVPYISQGHRRRPQRPRRREEPARVPCFY